MRGSISRQKYTIASSFGSQYIDPVKTSDRAAGGMAGGAREGVWQWRGEGGRSVFGQRIGGRIGQMKRGGGVESPRPFPDISARNREQLGAHLAHPGGVGLGLIRLLEREIRDLVTS